MKGIERDRKEKKDVDYDGYLCKAKRDGFDIVHILCASDDPLSL